MYKEEAAKIARLVFSMFQRANCNWADLPKQNHTHKETVAFQT